MFGTSAVKDLQTVADPMMLWESSQTVHHLMCCTLLATIGASTTTTWADPSSASAPLLYFCRLVGEQAESYWLYNVPWSISRMLRYMKNRYDNPYIWVLENGISEKGEAYRQGDSALQDRLRTDYFKGYISEACK